MVQSRELVTEHIWLQVNLHCFGLPKALIYEGLHKFGANGHIHTQKWMKIELTNGEPPGEKAGCPIRGLLLGCDIS